MSYGRDEYALRLREVLNNGEAPFLAVVCRDCLGVVSGGRLLTSAFERVKVCRCPGAHVDPSTLPELHGIEGLLVYNPGPDHGRRRAD